MAVTGRLVPVPETVPENGIASYGGGASGKYTTPLIVPPRIEKVNELERGFPSTSVRSLLVHVPHMTVAEEDPPV
jgi:hypothetical protein